jgi:hypothetical protein
MRTVAALYVDMKRGPYAKMEGVAAVGLPYDARGYEGPYPVVAHPSCAPWGRFAAMHGHRDTSERDGDKSCGPIAVHQVRAFGGVLEHPQGSSLWRHTGMPFPGEGADSWGGYTILVNQCDWGHKCKKATWLYIVGVHPADLPPMPPPGTPTHSMGVTRAKRVFPELPKSQRHLTPPDFANWLVEVARRSRLTLPQVRANVSHRDIMSDEEATCSPTSKRRRSRPP